MPNLGMPKELKCQYRTEYSSVASRECRKLLRQFERGMKGFFMTRRGNVVNVETVKVYANH